MTLVSAEIAATAERRLASAMQMKQAHYWLLGSGGMILIFVLFGMGIFPASSR